MSNVTLEPGSFRDKVNRVFYQGGEVYRALSHQALEHFIQLASTAFYRRYCEEGNIIATRVAPFEKLPASARGPWAVILHHDRIPFVSYPYEWTFSMLQDAALFHLKLLTSALGENMSLKDASSYNIQWKGTRPVFIDIPSFVPWKAGQTWVGYRQFCQLFLFPLLLQAHRGVRFQSWLRGSIDGISIEECSQLLSRDFYKPGVLADVLIHARVQKSYSKTSERVGDDLSKAGFHKELILANLNRLTKIVQRLSWKETSSEWSNYPEDRTYDTQEYLEKIAFVERISGLKKRRLVWDLGCNTGDFSKAVAPHARYVVAVDGDARVVDALYHSLRTKGPHNILPLTLNLADLSSGLGWLGQERKAFADRGSPDLVLCLALVHHMTITANIPMNEWIHWLATFKTDLIIEFIPRSDPMVQRLLRNKDENHDDYDQDVFEVILAENFKIMERRVLPVGKRILYACETQK